MGQMFSPGSKCWHQACAATVSPLLTRPQRRPAGRGLQELPGMLSGGFSGQRWRRKGGWGQTPGLFHSQAEEAVEGSWPGHSAGRTRDCSGGTGHRAQDPPRRLAALGAQLR